MANKTGKGQWAKGQSGNPRGRKKGENSIDDLRVAIKTIEKAKKLPLMQHFVERAYDDDTVLVALMRKLIPDIRITDINLTGEELGVIVLPGKVHEGAPVPEQQVQKGGPA